MRGGDRDPVLVGACVLLAVTLIYLAVHYW
jgi:hypothetical protein